MKIISSKDTFATVSDNDYRWRPN